MTKSCSLILVQVPVPASDLLKPTESVDKDFRGMKRKIEDSSDVGPNRGARNATTDPDEDRILNVSVLMPVAIAKTDSFLSRDLESSKNLLSDPKTA